MSVEVDPTMEAAVAVEMPEAAEGQPAVPAVDRALVAQLMAQAQRQGLSVEGEGGLLAQLDENGARVRPRWRDHRAPGL